MIQKVKRDTLSEQVTQGLIEFIDAESLSPGDSLPSESKLAEEFGVSRPIIREAMKTLQGEGIIEIVTGKNAVIKPISSAMLRKFFDRAITLKSASFGDLIEARRGLEIQSVMLAAERCTDADIAKMHDVIQQMRKHITEHEVFAGYDVQFHLLIASAAQNPVIYHLVESIRDTMRDNALFGLGHLLTDKEYQQVQLRHEAILKALEAHDPQAAQIAMEEHFDTALKASLNKKDNK